MDTKNLNKLHPRQKPDQLLPGDFTNILTRRFLPALGLTYAVSVTGLAARNGHFFYYFFQDKTAYVMALVIALWVSIPALLWIFIRCLYYAPGMADDWYKITCGVLGLFLLISFLLFPEANLWGLKIYFAATIPVFFLMYLLLVKDGLSAAAAYPLTALGLTFLIHGAVINLMH